MLKVMRMIVRSAGEKTRPRGEKRRTRRKVTVGYLAIVPRTALVTDWRKVKGTSEVMLVPVGGQGRRR